MTTTYERIRELNQPKAIRPNMLKDLHDCIYRWAETIPTGGAKIDISDNLKDIYQTHSERISRKKANMQAATQKRESATPKPVAASPAQQDHLYNSPADGVSLKGTPYDPMNFLDFGTEADEDAYYDEIE